MALCITWLSKYGGNGSRAEKDCRETARSARETPESGEPVGAFFEWAATSDRLSWVVRTALVAVAAVVLPPARGTRATASRVKGPCQARLHQSVRLLIVLTAATSATSRFKLTFSLVDITADLSGEQLSRISKGCLRAVAAHPRGRGPAPASVTALSVASTATSTAIPEVVALRRGNATDAMVTEPFRRKDECCLHCFEKGD